MKIICSIGPNVKKNIDIDNLVKSGMDMMRFNFSHINYDHAKELMMYSKQRHPRIPIIQDLQGNKLRISPMLKGEIKVYENEEVLFCSEKHYLSHSKGNDGELIIPIKLEGEFSLLYKVKELLMKDATMKFKVEGINEDEEIIYTKVIRGGIIRGGKGINAPGIDRSKMSLTSKDKRDIIYGLKNRVDIICLSYVTCSKNILELRSFINKMIKNDSSLKMPNIWAKIECLEGVKNVEHIIKVVDGIMLGRGDLSAEINMLEFPKIQLKLINIMRKSNKDFVIGTYILESMKYSSVPSPAEINDIYNFINNKVNGVMLTGEVAVGRYPLETVSFLKNMINTYK